ncbi:MAG: hypothetical protein CML20_17115 [Rheinheimera sp.]|uniref:HEPN domain-containing protein n=1 Tax=Arsukibacterium sp. UBA3155 TaxID=1946058 RepID=UPI000C8C7FB0|nr:HEPN domain-containing protein [Arsukibacterium sp. UBA3155]MAD76480.1 hypothetical protein [Rheinheimera sp.]
MTLPKNRTDITKLLISTPSHFVGEYENDIFRLVRANQNMRVSRYAPRTDERIYREYIEITVETPECKKETIVIPDYSQIGENFCIALSVLYGKRFDFHGLIQQHGWPYIPLIESSHQICNTNLSFNSTAERVDYKIELNLENVRLIENVLFQHDSETTDAQSTFWYAGRFYIQAIRVVEESPEVAFLSLITAGEIIASYFEYPVEDLLDQSAKKLLIDLNELGELGRKLHKQVAPKLTGISEAFCKCILDCLDKDFFSRSEAVNDFEKLTELDIKQRLKAAYNLRSKYVHAGKLPSSWMAVNYLNDNQEVIHGDPVIGDKDMQKSIKRSPTFIGLERIVRYSLIKFLIKTKVIESEIEIYNKSGQGIPQS